MICCFSNHKSEQNKPWKPTGFWGLSPLRKLLNYLKALQNGFLWHQANTRLTWLLFGEKICYHNYTSLCSRIIFQSIVTDPNAIGNLGCDNGRFGCFLIVHKLLLGRAFVWSQGNCLQGWEFHICQLHWQSKCNISAWRHCRYFLTLPLGSWIHKPMHGLQWHIL